MMTVHTDQTVKAGDTVQAEQTLEADAAGLGAGEPAPPPDIDDPRIRAEMRRRVEETEQSLRSIAADMRIPYILLWRTMRTEGWIRPDGAPLQAGASLGRARLAADIVEAHVVVNQLLRAVNRQVTKIERRARKPGSDIEERDARMLVALARTMQTLTALGRDDGARQATEPRDRNARDAELLRRIEGWAERGKDA